MFKIVLLLVSFVVFSAAAEGKIAEMTTDELSAMTGIYLGKWVFPAGSFTTASVVVQERAGVAWKDLSNNGVKIDGTKKDIVLLLSVQVDAGIIRVRANDVGSTSKNLHFTNLGGYTKPGTLSVGENVLMWDQGMGPDDATIRNRLVLILE